MQGFIASCKSKMQTKIKQLWNADSVYLTGFTLFITITCYRTTMWKQPFFLILLESGAAGLVLLKMACFDSWTMWELLVTGTLILLSLIVYKNSGATEPVFWMVFLLGARNVEFERILRVWFVCSMVILTITILGACMGAVVDLQYPAESEEGKYIRHAFGILYPTDFAAHIFTLCLAGTYLYRKIINLIWCVLGLGLTYVVYTFTHARLDSICLLLVWLGYFVFILLRRLDLYSNYRVDNKGMTLIKCSIMPVSALVMIFLSRQYDSSKIWLDKLNSILSTRLSLGKMGMEKYGFSFLGQRVEQIGGGGSSTIDWAHYFFLDCSYLYIGIPYGVLMLCVVLLVAVGCSYRYRNDKYFIFSMLLISLNCMIAHHLMALEYFPFLLAMFTSKSDDETMTLHKRVRI